MNNVNEIINGPTTSNNNIDKEDVKLSDKK